MTAVFQCYHTHTCTHTPTLTYVQSDILFGFATFSLYYCEYTANLHSCGEICR